MLYVALINTPGYLPQDDDPPVFDDAAGAWEYLADERSYALDSSELSPGPDSTLGELRRLAHLGRQAPIGHSVVGPTPGYAGSHDLGQAYTVMIAPPPECEGHADGPVMGETFYCDGSCNRN